MIRALAGRRSGRWNPPQASRKKRDALFELATRISIIAERSRAFERDALAEAALVESRKLLRTGLEMASSGAEIEAIEAAIAANPAFERLDAGDALELELTLAGLRGLLAREHPYAIMRRMSARLGIEYFDRTETWILSRLDRQRPRSEPLIVPGELPDVIRALALDPRSLELCLRAAGWNLAAAALAGCPQESFELAKPFFGKIGGTMLEDDVALLRSRLSGDEISEAQATFAEIIRGMGERGRLKMGEEADFAAPPAFVEELTKAILSLDDRVLKTGLRGIDGQMLSMAMQGMEPGAHERILGVLAKRDERKLLDAIDDASPLDSRAILDAGRRLSAKLLAAAHAVGGATARTVSPEALARLAAVKDWRDG